MRIVVIIVVLVALAAIAGLGVYALRLWREVWQRRDAQAARHAEARADQHDSLRLLAGAVRTDDLNLSEAAIRMKVLLDQTHPDGSGPQQFPAIYAMHDALVGFARGAQRRALPEAERRRQDAARERLEAQHRDAVLAEIQRF